MGAEMKYLHICNNEKFIDPYIKFIEKNFDKLIHVYIIIGENRYSISDSPNVIVVDNFKENYSLILKEIKNSDKFFLHGLNNTHLIYLLFLRLNNLKKCYWIIWGADLYEYYKRKNSPKDFIKHLIRKEVFKRIGGFITHIKGDYELAKEWYGAKGKHYYSFMYPSNLYKEYSLSDGIKQDDRVYIQIGNSADSTNNHIEVLDKLQRYKDMDIEIICPLSYGDKAYAKKVINYGTEIFGDKFVPITEFMPFDKYLDILAKIDIAIFNHKRQQAMGNITTLLGLGKKVYIREEITTWQFCLDHDLKVYSANDNYDDLFEEMDEGIRQKNIENVKSKFSEEKLVEDLKQIFDEEIN